MDDDRSKEATTMTSTSTLGAVRVPDAVGSPAIVARNLTKRFGSLTAVDDLSFQVRPGHVTGFLGPNGAGKSTTLRMILGLVTPTSGSASVLGLPYAGLDRPMQSVGAVLEVQSFHPLRSGRDHLRVLAAAAGLRDHRLDDVLEQVGLAEAANRKAGKYSLGMRQRLGLAGALLGEPDILILDEPANGLDPQGIRWLRELLRSFAEQGNAVLVSSHLLSEMAQMADDIIVVNHGRLIRQGAVTELTGTTSLVVASPEMERLEAALTTAGIESRGSADGLVVAGGKTERIGRIALTAQVPLSRLHQVDVSLEDVFLELTEEVGSR
jgi:ABC-2 type transport system ATP-binding protein